MLVSFLEADPARHCHERLTFRIAIERDDPTECVPRETPPILEGHASRIASMTRSADLEVDSGRSSTASLEIGR
ncbi:MAG: hypothetical protein P8182_01520 [Deltaproteobacteria bacterium]